MTKDEALEWLEGLTAKRKVQGFAGNASGFTSWMMEAEALFARVFVPSDAVLLRYRAAVESYVGQGHRGEGGMHRLHTVIGAFDACSSVLKERPMETVFWKLQIADTGEVLEQATEVIDGGYSLAAAAVLGGGALEQHLLHLCGRYSIQWTGRPSISAYNNAVRAARAKQAVPYEEPDAKQVDAWGAIRNEAAHKPGGFARDKGEVARMIDGIRSFLARVH